MLGCGLVVGLCFQGKGTPAAITGTEAGVGWIHGALCRVLSMDILHRHARQPGLALVLELAPRAVHRGLGVVVAIGDTFDGGFQKRGDPALAVRVGWRG